MRLVRCPFPATGGDDLMSGSDQAGNEKGADVTGCADYDDADSYCLPAGGPQEMRRVILIALLLVAIVSGCATLFFAWFGVQLVYHALTFEGEGSLGHVGMYIAAGLYPVLAFVFGGITYISWGAFHRRRRDLRDK